MTSIPSSRPAALAPGRLAVPLLLALAACDTAPVTQQPPPMTPAAAPAERPSPVPPPSRRPVLPEPSPASTNMAGYYRTIEETLIARGLLRTDNGAGERPPAQQLADNFVQVALHDEYQMQGGQLVPNSHAAPLRRWQMPVRVAVEFGPSVPPLARARDRADIAGFASRLASVSGHEVTMTEGTGNFVVLVVNEDERRNIGPRLNALIPGIPAGDVAAIQGLSPQNYCTVFAYSPGGQAAYSNAVAVIRAELPQRLRTSCVHEEMAQGMGLANDSPTARPSIFNDDEEFAFLTTQDELLLKMLYDKRLSPGMTETQARPIAQSIATELTR